MIAYQILVHRYPEQFKRLFRAIYRPDNYYVVHVDKRSELELNTDIKQFLSSFQNTRLLLSKNALWGGYSLVDAELRGIQALLDMGANWEVYMNLSGQDFPLKSQEYITAFLKKNRGKDFLKVADQREMRPSTNARFENYCIELHNKIIRTPFKRKFLAGATPYIGNQWVILTRKFCEFLCYSPEVTRFKKFYRHTFIADESFFQTVIMNTTYKATIINDDMRAIDWIPDGNIKLRPRTFTSQDARYLLTSKQLFARKFDEGVDSAIIDILEKQVNQE